MLVEPIVSVKLSFQVNKVCLQVMRHNIAGPASVMPRRMAVCATVLEFQKGRWHHGASVPPSW